MNDNLINEISTKVKSGGRNMTVFGFITMFLGLATISAPAFTGLSIVVSIGVLMMAGGILRMLWAFGAGTFGKGALVFALGGLTLLCGLTLVTDPLVASGFLTVIISICLFADGLAEIFGAFRLHAESGRMWLLIGGIVSILLALMIWRQFPLSGAWALGVLLGIKLLFVGLVMITGGSAVRFLAKDVGALA